MSENTNLARCFILIDSVLKFSRKNLFLKESKM